MWEMDYDIAARYWTDKEKDAVSMDSEDLQKRIDDFIGEHNTCLMYDFLKAEEAIQASTQYDDIHEWVDAVVEKLEPSVKDYSKKQIDLTMALILHEKTI